MEYIDRSFGSAYIPKLLGIYERELHSTVEDLIANAPALLIDIGAAEGYYTVGLAKRLPKARVVAFELELPARDLLSELASRNQVQNRIKVMERCDSESLNKTIQEADDVIIIGDVEGFELDLLDPKIIPALLKTSILVETHDCFIPNITKTLRGRFEGVHSINEIMQEKRLSKEFPYDTFVTRLLPDYDLNWLVCEWRPSQMSWLWMTPDA